MNERMGHSSNQVTVGTYGHLIPGADVRFVDRLDGIGNEMAKTSPQQSATPAQSGEMEVPPDLLQVVEQIGGGGRTRTYDLRIMSSETPVADKEDKELSSAESGKILQDPQPPRNNEQAFNPVGSDSGKPNGRPKTEETKPAKGLQPPLSGTGPQE